MKYWKEPPGRYFENSKEYKERIITRHKTRNIESKFLNRSIKDKEAESIIPFVSNCLIFSKCSYKSHKELYKNYKQFCTEMDLIPMSSQQFSIVLKTYIFLNNTIPDIMYSEPENGKGIMYYNLDIKK